MNKRKLPTYAQQMSRWARRRARIIRLQRAGLTQEAIGDRLGITKQRVGQILKGEI